MQHGILQATPREGAGTDGGHDGLYDLTREVGDRAWRGVVEHHVPPPAVPQTLAGGTE